MPQQKNSKFFINSQRLHSWTFAEPNAGFQFPAKTLPTLSPTSHPQKERPHSSSKTSLEWLKMTSPEISSRPHEIHSRLTQHTQNFNLGSQTSCTSSEKNCSQTRCTSPLDPNLKTSKLGGPIPRSSSWTYPKLGTESSKPPAQTNATHPPLQNPLWQQAALFYNFN